MTEVKTDEQRKHHAFKYKLELDNHIPLLSDDQDWVIDETIAHVEQLISEKEKEIERLNYELNNSMNYHCPHFLSNGSGTVSCNADLESKLKVAVAELEEFESMGYRKAEFALAKIRGEL